MTSSSILRFGTPALLVLAACLGTAAGQAQEPTAAHKILEKDEGEWKAEITMYIPGTDQTISGEGTEVNSWVAGGLWMLTHFKGDFQGQSFEGQGHIGYDPKLEKYVGTWIDSMTPHLSTMKGTYDEKAKTFTSMMDSVDPATGEKTVSKSVVKYVDQDHREMTMWAKGPAGGEEWVKSMEIKYSRK